VFAPGWEYKIELLKTSEGRIKQQQIAVLRAQAEASGLDPDDFLRELTANDHLLVKNWSKVGNWWALCAGDVTKVQALCRQHKWTIKDKRAEVPWPQDVASSLAMVMQPRPNQVGPFKTWVKAGHGIFKAAPAFGKTYVMVWLVADLKQQTLFLTHTDQLAEQFITRFRYGSPRSDGKEGFIPVTNCLQVEKELGREIIGRYRGPDTLWPVTVATWQSFISPGGRKAMKALRNAFGLVLADECHVFAAPSPASVINGFAAKQKRGVTATEKRKDRLDVALYDIVGQVTAEGKSDQLPVAGYLINSGVAYKGRSFPGMGEWARILNFLYKHADRNDLITKWLVYDAQQGRKILVLGERRNWILELAEKLKKEYGVMAKAVVGGVEGDRRQAIIQEMTSGELQVLLCTTKIGREGLDIPVLDTLYSTMPLANKSGLEQMLGRARRPHPAKTPPVIFRYFVDEGHGMLYGCAKATHKHLVAEGAEIFLVEAGREPAKVMNVQAEELQEDGVLDTMPKRTLKAAAARAPSAVRRLFTDLKAEARLTKQYSERMQTRKES
jgi:superfamily II DNA or RNA helicase